MFRLGRSVVGAVLAAVLVEGAMVVAPASVRAAPLPWPSAGFAPSHVVSAVDANEPDLAVAPDNTLYIDAPTGLLSGLGPSMVWRSTDNGESWEPTAESLRRLLPGGGDSALAVDPADGAVYLTDLWLGSATVATSYDRGVTWTANPLEGIVGQDRPWIATSGNGVVYHVTHQLALGLFVSKSIDGGLTYPVQSLAADTSAQSGCLCPAGNIVAAHGGGPLGLDDRVGFIYSTDDAVKFARSTDGGLHFSNVVVHEGDRADVFDDSFPVVALGPGRSLVAVWVDTRHATSTVWFSRSRNWGATWEPARQIVADGTSLYPSIAVLGGHVVVTLTHTAAVLPHELMHRDQSWYTTMVESTDLGATWSGLELVDPQRVKMGPICTDGLACLGNRQLGDFHTVRFDRTGHVVATWARAVQPDEKRSEIVFARR